MNHFDSSADDFEEVPSPFRKTTTTSRTNMFSRPVGTVPSEAPIVAEPSTRRRPMKAEATSEFLAPKRQAISAPAVDYLDDENEEDEEYDNEDDVVEKRPARKSAAKNKLKNRETVLPRIGWGIAVLLLLRLIFMERGVLQYAQMSGTIGEHETELARVKKENNEIRKEIRRIEFDKGYQRQLAKEHLGVIAADEFLILFAGEAMDSEISTDRPL